MPGVIEKNTGELVEKKSTQLSSSANIVSLITAATVSGIPADVVSFPACRIKTVRMTQIGQDMQLSNTYQTVRTIYRTQGVLGFYRGFIPQFLSFGPFNSIGLSMSVALHKKIPKEETTVVNSMAINGISFGTGALVTTPIDVVKTRIQVAAADPVRFPDRSILGCAKNIIKNEGMSALLSGATHRVAWLGSRQAIAFTLFGKVDAVCRKYLSDKKETPKGPSV